MLVCNARLEDSEIIRVNDKHISNIELRKKILDNEVYVAYLNSRIVGWLRYNLFWDNTPFINMLFVLPEYRNNGVGKALMNYFETEMKKKGYHLVLTSTMSSESAQNFYRKFGYVDAGSLLLKNEPLEIIFSKNI